MERGSIKQYMSHPMDVRDYLRETHLRGSIEGQPQDLKGTPLLNVSVSNGLSRAQTVLAQTSNACVIPKSDDEIYWLDGIYDPGDCERHLQNLYVARGVRVTWTGNQIHHKLGNEIAIPKCSNCRLHRMISDAGIPLKG